MQPINIILGGINLIIPILVAILQRINNTLLAAEESISQEYFDAYKELCSELIKIKEQEIVVLATLGNSLNRIRSLQQYSIKDVSKVAASNWFLGKVVMVSLLLFFAAVVSILIDYWFIPSKLQSLHIVLYCVPIATLAINTAILSLTLRIDRFLLKVPPRYKNAEYLYRKE